MASDEPRGPGRTGRERARQLRREEADGPRGSGRQAGRRPRRPRGPGRGPTARPPGAAVQAWTKQGQSSRETRVTPAPGPPSLTSAARRPRSPGPSAAALPPAPRPPSWVPAHHFCRHFRARPRRPAPQTGVRARTSGARSGSRDEGLAAAAEWRAIGWATQAAAGAEPGPWGRRWRAREGGRRRARGDGGLRAPPWGPPAVPGPEPRHSGR